MNDLEVLKFIKSKLSYLAGKEASVFTISEKNKTATFTIQNFNFIKELIFPIFNVYPLRSAKYLDLKEWKEAFFFRSIQPCYNLDAETLS